MAYSDFTLKKVKVELGINVIEDQNLFGNVPAITPSDLLLKTLEYNVPLAIAIGTEKARSEFIIANVLLEVRRILNNKISIFSGTNLDVNKEKGLTGYCDFILTNSPERFYVTAPIIAIVEAKNESIIGGLGQCIAEMYASCIFNNEEGYDVITTYGAVTTGNTWKFLKYKENKAYVDLDEYYIETTGKILGILVAMLKQDAAI